MIYLERLWELIIADVRSVERFKGTYKIQFPDSFKLLHTYFRQHYILRGLYLDFSVKVPNPA